LTDPRDPDELLRAANPIHETRVPAASQSAHAHRLFEKITGTSYHQPAILVRRRWTRTRVWVAALIATVGAAGGGIAYAVATSQPTKQLTTICYATANPAADGTAVTSSGQGALRDCAQAWTAGQIAATPAQAPPPLIACIVHSGVAGVFPDPDHDPNLCRQLRLRTITPQPAQPATTTITPPATLRGTPTTGPAASTTTTVPVPPVIAARNTIVAAFLAGCLDQPQATAVARRALDQAGLAGWTIQTNGQFSAARPCASPAFDETQHLVYLVPIPPNPAP